MLGGVCINTGTIPSKTLREAVLYLTGLDQREMYGQSYRVKDEITVADLTARTRHVVSREIDVVRSQLAPQPGHDPDRHRAVRRADTSSRWPTVTARSRECQRREDRHRDRHPAGAARQRRVRRADDHRLRRDPAPGPGAAVDGRGRRRA